MLYIEFIYRTTAVSYTTSQEEYRKIFIYNFFPKSRKIRIITLWEVRRSAMHREQLRMEQEWRARMEREVGARHHYQYQAMSVGQLHVHPAPEPQHSRPRVVRETHWRRQRALWKDCAT